MSDYRNTDYKGAAKATVDFVDHGNMPNDISDVVLYKLIVMSAESQINIWHRETGLSVASLEALYRLYQTGEGYRRSRVYAHYELGRMDKEREKNGDS